MITKADRIRGCFVGAAIGDALGMPVESMSRNAIIKALGWRGVVGYRRPLQTLIRDTINLAAGETTDDTHFFQGVAASLLRCQCFDIEDQARELVHRARRSVCGCGPTTQRASVELGRYFDGQPGGNCREPAMPAAPPTRDGDGCGNGVAVKIPPLAIWCYANCQPYVFDPFATQVVELGTMTHGDPRASFAAAAIGGAIAGLINLPQDQRIAEPNLQYAVIRLAHCFAWQAEQKWRYFRPNTPSLSDRLERAQQLLHDADALRTEVGTGPNALRSVPFAIATFLRHPYDFGVAVHEAVNAGGDADSTATMVGALAGATVGHDGLPQELRRGLLNHDQTVAMADEMIAALGVA